MGAARLAVYLGNHLLPILRLQDINIKCTYEVANKSSSLQIKVTKIVSSDFFTAHPL